MATADPKVLDDIVKAYDVRGTYPDQFNADIAHALGVGFARFCGASTVLVARDMRPSGPELVDAFARGVMEQGVDVIDLGLASTDLMYFAAGTLDAPGAMFTASHNPAQYNGVKFCLAGAKPVGQDTGLDVVKATAVDVLHGRGPATAPRGGSRSERVLLDAFADHVVSFIDVASLAPLRVVADTANGMGGLVVPAVFERIPQITLEVMYGELDGTFPNHPADPLQPANQRDLQARVVAGGFDIGLAFDGDADRVFVVDETGRGLSGSTTSMLMLDEVSRAGQPLSEVRKPFERYESSGEINTAVADASVVIEGVASHFRSANLDRLDGLTVDCGDWWFNLRPSNTEPLLRLNLEAPDRDQCDTHVAELLALITSL